MEMGERSGIRSEALTLSHTGVGLAPDAQPGNGTSEIHNSWLYAPDQSPTSPVGSYKGEFDGSSAPDTTAVQTWFEQGSFNNTHGTDPMIDESTGYPPQN